MLDQPGFSHDAGLADALSDIAGDALAGLTAARKTLPPKLFYDAEGVRLFAEITRLPEYYLTRIERAVLATHAVPLMQALCAPGSVLVEYGASDEGKAEFLFAASMGRIAAYVPVDVAADALVDLTARLENVRPDLRVMPVVADFLAPFSLPHGAAGLPALGFFPGSTIGNLDPASAVQFLTNVRRSLGRDAAFIVGVDLAKDPAVLRPAYDDAAGVTAAFNRNVLVRLNREAGADFDIARFAHRAVWNAALGRIEMHLESRCAQRVHVAGVTISFADGETIHTENSYKHTMVSFAAIAAAGGWRVERVITDPQAWFSLQVLRPA